MSGLAFGYEAEWADRIHGARNGEAGSLRARQLYMPGLRSCRQARKVSRLYSGMAREISASGRRAHHRQSHNDLRRVQEPTRAAAKTALETKFKIRCEGLKAWHHCKCGKSAVVRSHPFSLYSAKTSFPTVKSFRHDFWSRLNR